MGKLLSIIIPSYNMEAYLPKCLGSLLGDEGNRALLEAIVVNDGSRDRTSEIAHDYERRYPNVVRVIDKPNGHYGSAVNAGLAAAKGLYVKNLDADDTFVPEGLAALLARIEADRQSGMAVDLYLTDYAHVDEQGRTTRTVSYDLPTDRLFGVDEILAKTKEISMHACTWRVELLRKIGYRQSEGIAYSDWEWILYPMLKTRCVRYQSVRVYRYLYGRDGQSVSLIERRRNEGSWKVLLDRSLAMCRTDTAGLSAAARDYLLRVIVGMAHMSAETSFVFSPIGNHERAIVGLVADLESAQKGLATRLEDGMRIMKSTLNIPYLRIWRKLPFGKTPFIFLVRGYLVITRWIG